MPRIAASALSIVLLGFLVLAAYADIWIVAAVTLLVQTLVASAPGPTDARGRSVPAPRFAAAIVAGIAGTALAVKPDLLATEGQSSMTSVWLVESGVLAGILPATALGVWVALISQMFRKGDRTELVTSTGYAVSLAVFAVLSAAWVGAVKSFGGTDIVVLGALSATAALLIWLIPLERRVCANAAVVIAALTGGGAAATMDSVISVTLGVAVGGAAGLFAIAGQVLGRVWTRRRRHAGAGWGFPAAMSVAMTAPVVYIGSQLVGSGI